jgi:hypothetical protein
LTISSPLERGATERDPAGFDEFELALVEGAEFIGLRQVLLCILAITFSPFVLKLR